MDLLRSPGCGLVFLLVAAAAPATARAGTCATKPPPESLPERCQSHKVVVPSTIVELRMILGQWMATCAMHERGPALVEDNPSVEKVWALIGDKPHSTYVIVPKYTPLTFKDAGRTCYGIGSVTFSVRGGSGVVDDTGPTDVTRIEDLVPSDDDIIAAATEGEAALTEFPGSDDAAQERHRMLSVLQAMKSMGKDLDDTYYVVAPITLAPGLTQACYKTELGRCRDPDDALRACSAHLGLELFRMHKSGTTRKALAAVLLQRSNAINVGLQSLKRMQAAESPAALPCGPAIEELMAATANRARGGKTLYAWWER